MPFCVLIVIWMAGSLASCAAPRAPVAPPEPPPTAPAASCSQGQAKRCREQAKELAVSGDLAGAFALMERGCAFGDDDSCFDLAVATHDGKGRPADMGAGRKIFADACQRGHAASCATLGTLLHRAHEVERGTELRERACGLGYQGACNDIGVELVDAPAPARDPARARRLFERACDAGVPAACSNLAFTLEPAEGDRETAGRVVALLVRACEGKNPAGCREIGIRHVNGDGLPKDEVAASSEFEIACAGDDAAGCDWLGDAQENGLGRPKDTQAAIANYGKACDKSSYDGCYHLGTAYAIGRGIEKDEKHARDLYERACAGGISQACYAVANLRIPGDKTSGEARLDELCKKDKTFACAALGGRLVWKASTRRRGLDLLRGACEKGNVDACETGLYSADAPRSGAKRDPVELFFFAERACRAKTSCGKFAGLLLRGTGTNADPKRAAEIAVAACDRDDGVGCLVAAQIHQEGKGTPRDAPRAYGFLERGCEHDNAEACDGQARALRKGDGVARDVAHAKEIEEKARDLRED